MKKILLTALMAVMASCYAHGQENIATLTAQLKKHPDSLGIKLKLATTHATTANTDSALLLFNEVAQTALKINDIKTYAFTEINIGRFYADKGDNVKALHHFQLAQQQVEKIDDKKLLAHVLKNIGALYASWKKFEEALAYYSTGGQLAAQVNDTELVADFNNNKGVVYEQQEKYDQALVAYKNALDIYSSKNISSKISMVLSNLAIVYKLKKDYPSSLKYNLKALALSEKENEKWMMAATYNNIGSLYMEMKDFERAITYANKSLELAKNIDALEIVQIAYETLAMTASKAGDYKKAYEYQLEYATYKDKFINIESTRQLSELNVKYETEKKQKLIQLQQFEISRRNMMIVIIAVVFVAAFAIGYQLYTRNKLQQKAALQAAALQHQAAATRAIIAAEEKERKRIALDLHDGVGQLFSAVKLNLSGLLERANLTDTGLVALGDKTLDMVDESCREVRFIAHQMMPGSLLQNGLVTAVRDFIKKIDYHQLKIEFKTDGLEGRFDSNIETVLYRIVQECVNNVIKHAGASRLDIIMRRNANYIYTTIADNGRGFNINDKKQFEGMGIKNIITRASYLKGHVDISSEENKGTLIAIQIPIS